MFISANKAMNDELTYLKRLPQITQMSEIYPMSVLLEIHLFPSTNESTNNCY